MRNTTTSNGDRRQQFDSTGVGGRSRRRLARAAARAAEAAAAADAVGGDDSIIFDRLEERQLMAAPAGGTVTVDAGSYAETVTVNKSLTIDGAEAGVDARSNVRRAAGNETILTGGTTSAGVGAGFYVDANDVTIDGFTVQGETSQDLMLGAGIVIAPSMSGTHVVNDIVQNNVSGLFLANDSATDPAVIQHDVFQNNNNAGVNGGRGIYTDQSVSGGTLTNVTIDGNTFFNNRGGSGTTGLEGAVALESGSNALSQTNITITNNTFDSDGKAILVFNVTGLLFQGNVVTRGLDWYSGIVRFEGNDHNVTITGNNLFANTGPAIAIDTKGFPGDDSGFSITGNNIYGNGTTSGSHFGVVVNGNVYDGALTLSGNYWGSASGPGGDGPGTGDTVYDTGHVVSGQTWSVTADTGYASGTSLDASAAQFATAPVVAQDTAYWGLPASDGAIIQAEDFDEGGQGIGYSTSTGSNAGGQYRTTGVGIEATTDTGGGYDVGWTGTGEWLDYAVDLTEGGTYRVDLRVASPSAGATLRVLVDGVQAGADIAVPNTGGWQTWQTVSLTNVPLTAGDHTVRILFVNNNAGGGGPNINWFELTNTAPMATPMAPTGLTATANGTAEVDLAWTNAAASATGVSVQRSTDGVNYTTLMNLSATAASYADTGLAPLTTYYYRVVATNVAGASPASNVTSATTAPAAVTNLTALAWTSATAGWSSPQVNKSIKGTTLTLRGTTYATGIGTHASSTITYSLAGRFGTFTSAVGIDDETAGQGAADFQVYGDGKLLFDSGVLTGTSPVVTLTVNVTGVQTLTLVATPGVAGTINYDHADWAGAQLLVAAPVLAVPTAPTGLTVAGATTAAYLCWTNAASTLRTGVAVDRSSDGGNTWTTIATLAASANYYADTTLSAGTSYVYRVRATNAAGSSPASNTAAFTTFATATVTTGLTTLAPTSSVVGYGTLQTNESVDGNTITLRGTTYATGLGAHAVSDVTYALGGKYATFLSDVGIDDEVNGQGSVDFQVIGDGKVLYDSGVLTGASAIVHVAVNVTGVQTLTLQATNGVAGSIDYDHADWAGPQLLAAAAVPTAPAAPVGLTATAGSASTIYLSWSAAGTNQTGFTIQRSTNGGTSWTTIATVAANATNYTDAGLSASATYAYQVMATNNVGSSPASSIATATTLAAAAVTTNLSTLTPTSATVGWGTLQDNASIKGNPITLRGTVYATGLGAHASSTITYALGGTYATFLSDVGIDDETAGQGSVDFQVYGDGKLLYDSGVLTGTSPVAHVNVSVAGVQTLTLIALPGVTGSIDYDHADWAGAKLVAAATTTATANLTTAAATSTMSPARAMAAAEVSSVKVAAVDRKAAARAAAAAKKAAAIAEARAIAEAKAAAKAAKRAAAKLAALEAKVTKTDRPAA
jgi:hypothetical protein